MDFDVFLSHNGNDKPTVRELKRLLAAKELRVWLDEDELRPGIPWQRLLEAGITRSASVAVLVGNDGLGPWEDEEMQGALRLAVNNERPVIPVLLPGSPPKPQLPMFLENRTWVDLRAGFNEEGLARLIWGITGSRPQANSTGPRSDETRLNERAIPQRSPDRRGSHRDYIDEIVAGVAAALLQKGPLTMRALVLELNGLFNRGTFRFEPLRECITFEWSRRLLAAMQTLELLRSYAPFVADQVPEDRTYEKLMDEVNGYSLAMATYLFRGPVKVSELRDFVSKDEFLRSLPAPKRFTKGIDDEINDLVDGPRIRAIEQMDKLRTEFIKASQRDQSTSAPAALKVWKEKLTFLQGQEAAAADPAQKFGLRKLIEEARARILELGG
jgi:TIR domain